MEIIKWEYVTNSNISNNTLEIYHLPLTHKLNIINNKLFICRNNYYHILMNPTIKKEKYYPKTPSIYNKNYIKIKYIITFKTKISSNRKNLNNPIDDYLNSERKN